jgi:hypothetical protein
MIKKLLTAAAVCAALSSGAAQATTFDFSYTFTDGQELTGSFSGTTANGGLSATNISNLQVSFAGTAFTGGVSPTLILNSWNSSSTSPGWNSASVPTTIYANGSLNNFSVSDVDASVNTSPDYEFVYVNDTTNGIYQATAANFTTGQLDLDAPGNAAGWTLSEVAAPVPLPAALPLLASSFGGLGFLGFRRRRAVR